MIDAPAGAGKAFTERLKSARLRDQGMTVLIVDRRLNRNCRFAIARGVDSLVDVQAPT